MVMIMDNEQIRQIVADHVSLTHGNEEFIRQIRNGEQDDGPFMQAGYAVRDWVAAQMAPVPELIDE
jgi:hypothetical protein